MKRRKYATPKLVVNKLAVTTRMKIVKPIKNKGFLPKMSAHLGKIKDPTKHPAMKDEPTKPIAVSLTQ